jgi:hypothetical protein
MVANKKRWPWGHLCHRWCSVLREMLLIDLEDLSTYLLATYL